MDFVISAAGCIASFCCKMHPELVASEVDPIGKFVHVNKIK